MTKPGNKELPTSVPGSPAPVGSPERPVLAFRRQLILLVDDDPVNNEFLGAYLVTSLGCEVEETGTGEEAIALMARRRPDLVLLDIHLPGKDGFEICRLIRSAEATKMLPVVMITAFNDKRSKIASLEAGADDFLAKPVDRVELLARVKSLLRLEELRGQLQESYARLKVLQQLKDDLAGMITHDINNFLAIINGNLELIAMERATLSQDVREDVEAALEATADLMTLVSDFLDIARMEDSHVALHFEHTNVAKLVARSIDRTALMVKKAHVSLVAHEIAPDLVFRADKGLMLRVVMNLLLNAIKFTPSGGRIEIGASAEADAVKIFVKDTGFGIPPEFQKKIFEKFTQLEVKQAHFKRGRGLGLTFCKMAVEAHGGKIWVESEGDGRGSAFFLTLPLNAKASGRV